MKIFVYGTLKRNYGNNRLLSNSTFLKEKLVDGFKLLDSGFPVAVPNTGSAISGELWEIGDIENDPRAQAVLQSLDRLEGEGRMYIRTEIDMDDDDGPFSLYVGHPPFWNHFRGMKPCSLDEKTNVYTWERDRLRWN